jgi:hypothetical protein
VPIKRLLETPPDRVPAGLAERVKALAEPIDLIRAAYVGVVQVTDDAHATPREQLSVAFELAAPPEASDEGERALQLIVDRFYASMPEDVLAGGCNLLAPGALDAWGDRAQRVFAR